MKAIIARLGFYFDYYIGYFLYSASTNKWQANMIKKYQDRYTKETNNSKINKF